MPLATKPTVFNKHGRIVHGFETGKALPYQIGLVVPPYVCGGTLISAKYGITADHCLNSGESTVVTARAYKSSDAWPYENDPQDQVRLEPFDTLVG